jgi:capsular exopolysaccharide synthesis family protein
MSTESKNGAARERGLPELVDAVRWRWKPALVVAAAFFIAATLYVESLPSQYDGTALVAIGPRPDVPSAGSDTVRVVAPKYVAYITARSTIQKIARKTGIDPDELDSALEANVATDTGNLSITVRLESPNRAAILANAFALEVVKFAKKDPLLEAQLIAPALPPATPAAPPRRLLEAAALLVGLLLGVGTAALLERSRPRVRSWRDLTRVTGYPVVGRVPRSRTLRGKPTAAFADPATGSAFRTLRANLEPQLRGSGDVLVVTSASKGDGKTTVASLFGEALARVDLKTLIIDADLRRPALGRFAGMRGDRGLSTVLREGTQLEDAIRPGWTDGLYILPTSQDLAAGDLLATRFEDVLEQARSRYDIVIIDTPPLLGTDDARTLLRLAKGVLLVVSAGTTLDEMNEAVLAVESLRAPLMGIVANRFPEARSTYY